MPKTKISEYSATNSANTDIEGINIDEGCPPSSINNAIRELMVHLKEFQTGSSGDPLTVAGGMFISGGGSANTMTVTGILTASGGTILSSTNTLSGSNIISGNINSSGTTNTFSGGNIFSGTNTFSGTNIFSSDVTLNAQKDLRFADSDSSNWVAFQAPATVASNVTWTLPAADGTSNQALVTNGSGTLSWATASASPGGSTTQLQYNNAGAFGGISGVTSDGTRITASTTIGVGGATPSTSGSGITFPATASASSDANTLDDYEEGTWTVTATPQTSGSITLSSNTGWYTKVGRLVVATSKLTVSAVSSPTGLIKISLPFTIGAFSGSTNVIMENTGNSTSVTGFWSILPSSDTGIGMYLSAATNPSATSAQQVTATSTFWFTASYFV